MYQSTVPYLVAGVGFEPHDLRVMSPTSYQAALLRDMDAVRVVPEAGIEPVRDKISRDFKSRASASSAIPAYLRRRRPFKCLYIISQRFSLVNPFLQKLIDKKRSCGLYFTYDPRKLGENT